ncbi:MAG: MerR family transcriptional regulator [Akkermansiaceae bacterium]|nr:MerR family transcriptional regulator [Akkermansiaceae bacterium]
MNGYYSIAKVAAVSGLSAPTLRFYEQEGLIPPVPRDGAGNRVYGEQEMTRINTIRCLRAAGLTLPHIKRYFALTEGGEDTLRIRRELLLDTQEQLIAQLEELQRCMSYLKLKLQHYDACLSALSKGEKPPVFHSEELNKLFADDEA